jgi:hypothetical protein
MKSPPKEAGRSEKAASLQTCDDPASVSAQLAQVNERWQSEALRLFTLYRQTGGARHWSAYSTHVAGIAARLRGMLR